MTFFGFKKSEFIFVSAILVLLVGVILVNLTVAYRKSRDTQRKDDIRDIYNALHDFQNENSSFPLSDNQGRILACLDDPENPPYDEEGNIIYSACDYGVDVVAGKALARDPLTEEGYKYFYISNGRRFQLYAALEGTSEAEYNPNIVARGLDCGVRVCNFGRASGTTPLDKSLDAYENEISK